jgi:hypothetical protein
MESYLQSASRPGERLVLKMNITLSSSLAAEVPGYARLQREMHDALRAQHPEWIDEDGNSPTCDSYEARFAELLAANDLKLSAVETLSRALERAPIG